MDSDSCSANLSNSSTRSNSSGCSSFMVPLTSPITSPITFPSSPALLCPFKICYSPSWPIPSVASSKIRPTSNTSGFHRRGPFLQQVMCFSFSEISSLSLLPLQFRLSLLMRFSIKLEPRTTRVSLKHRSFRRCSSRS